MKKLYRFGEYSRLSQLNENGYGKEPFYFVKDGKSYLYYFKIKGEEGLEAYYIRINKTSDYMNISDPENRYCVVSLFKVDPDDLDDYLVRDRKSPLPATTLFDFNEYIVNEIWKTFLLVIEDYMDKNPKVTHVYDEMQKSFVTPNGYLDLVKAIMSTDDAPRWSIQDTSENGVVQYTKKDHD